MTNIVFNAGLRDLFKGATAFDTADLECILERSTSTYAPDKDDDSLLDQAGWVEITVATYARQDLGSKTIVEVDASDLVKIDCADVAFGNLEAGQTVKSIIVARNDAANYIPLLRIDTDDGALLPRALGGGAFTVQIHASGLLTAAQV